jgi:ribonuclease Z
MSSTNISSDAARRREPRRSDLLASIFREVSGIVLLLMALVPATAEGQEIKVTLLGTGTPPPAMNRFGPSILVETGGQKFLFDAGRGALQRLAQLRVRWQDVDGVFLTPLHSDHVAGFPDLWLTGWLVNPGRIECA